MREDVLEHVGGAKARRRKRTRRACLFVARGVLMLCVLATGFVVMDTLLRIAQAPLPEGEDTSFAVTTQPDAPGTQDANSTQQSEKATPQAPLRSFYVRLNMLDTRVQAEKLVAQAKAEKTTAAVVLFKDSGGYLSYGSGLMQATTLQASQKRRWRTFYTLRNLKRDAGQRIVGVIHCFDDPLAAGQIPEAAVMQRSTDDVPWRDARGKRWLNPYAETAREYLLALVREAVSQGAQDILLCGVQFPADDLTAAVFPGEQPAQDPAPQRNAALRDFVAQAKEALGGEGRLYVMISAEAALDGAPALGGNLWDCAADRIAIDVRTSPWAPDAAYWKARPVLPVVAAPADAKGERDYIVLAEEAQG
ncbi:MAG: putative glycoside hydrolase [Oscillospiraceae bacterium]|nr:putative glycoside hydrolase [Oscillospiraceae bacterium]